MISVMYLDAGITMAQAGANALMGIMIVLLSLAFIAIVINLFNVVNKLSAGKNAKAPEALQPVQAAVAEVEEYEDDTELIAVIMAAIVSYEAELGNSVSPDDLVVRSVRKIRRR